MPRPSWMVALALAAGLDLACGPTTGDDADGGNGGSTSMAASTDGGADTGATSVAGTGTGTTTRSGGSTDGPDPDSGSGSGGAVDCAMLELDECGEFEACTSISGAEALPQEAPGEYECTDVLIVFACMPADCRSYEGIVCNLEDPSLARWLIGECIPQGWEICPDDARCI